MISIKEILPNKDDRDLIRWLIQETGGCLYKVTDLTTGMVIYSA